MAFRNNRASGKFSVVINPIFNNESARKILIQRQEELEKRRKYVYILFYLLRKQHCAHEILTTIPILLLSAIHFVFLARN